MLREVGERVVVGQQHTVRRRDRVDRGLHRNVQPVKERQVRRRVGAELIGSGRIRRDQLVTDQLRVLDRERGVHPEVRVRLPAGLGEREVVHVLVLADDVGAKLIDASAGFVVGVRKAQRGVLEVQAVQEDDVRLADQPHRARRRFERMRVDSFGDQTVHVDDGAGHIAICDVIPYYMLMLDRVRRQSHQFDILHFHIDYLHFPLFRDISSRVLTTLHGRQDLPDNKPIYIGFDEMRLISISNSQRIPIANANFAATIYHGLPGTDLKPTLHPEGATLHFLVALLRRRVQRPPFKSHDLPVFH